jgi:hypothetical protein
MNNQALGIMGWTFLRFTEDGTFLRLAGVVFVMYSVSRGSTVFPQRDLYSDLTREKITRDSR